MVSFKPGDIILYSIPDWVFLKNIKEGHYIGDLDEDIEKRLDIIRKIRDTSVLRDKPDWGKINKLCQNMILRYWNSD